MGSTYQGGLGGRDGGDLIRWKLDIDQGVEPVSVFGRDRPEYVQTRPTTAELTLYDVNREESIAVVQMLNEMRSAAGGITIMPSKSPSIGDRFAGLEFD